MFLTKNPNLKKKMFFFFFFGRGGGGRWGGEGMARVSKCFTMDPNKKMFLEWGGCGGGGGGG